MPKEKHFWLSIIALLSLVLFAVQVNANQALKNLKPGQWYKFPTHSYSKMNSVTPPNNRAPNAPPEFSYDWRFFSKSVMDAWGGGAYDTKKNRLIIWGGGHADYVGNEVYAFNLEEVTSQGTGRWRRLTTPSTVPLNCNLRSSALKFTIENREGDPNGCLTEEIEIMGDGQPVSRHTYDSLQYLPSNISNGNVLWAQGGSRWPTGKCSKVLWFLNLENNVWKQKIQNAGTTKECELSVFSAYDVNTKSVFSFNHNTAGHKVLMRHNITTGSWTEVVNNHVINFSTGTTSDDTAADNLTAAIHPGKKMMIALGGVKGNKVVSYDLKNITINNKATFKEVPTNGATEITQCSGPGFDYDNKSQQLVAWCNTDDIYVLDIKTMRWSKQAPTSPNTESPRLPSDSNGTYGRFRYVPKYNVFVLATGTQQDVYAYKRSTLDADGNGGKDDALTDGLLFMRYMFGLRGDALISGAVDTSCTRCTSAQIESYVKQVGEELRSDIDGNGEVDALTDGLLISRYLFGSTENALIQDAIGDGCTRCTAPEITKYLGTLSTK